MNISDYAVIAAYVAVLLAIGYFHRSQKEARNYFLGDGKIGWQTLSLSAMATQLGAISFVSAPAFVGIREGGGMIWLTYELGVPLAMLLLLATLAPVLYRSGVVSIYEYVERRFGLGSRLILSLTFQISRGLATAVSVYAVSIILEAGFGVPFWQSLLIVGVGTVLYSAMGGMKAVVLGDALQMILIVLAILVCLVAGLVALGGIGPFLEQVDPQRLKVLKPASFGFSGDEFGLLPMVFGGIVLYASYYGCDQTQAQRLLAARNYGDARRVLLTNGLVRAPITITYCLMGLVIGTLAATTPSFLAQVPSDQPDRLIPVFLLNYLPHGLIGFVFVGLLAAAMSSLSSAVNSLAAVTIEDLTRLRKAPFSADRYLKLARLAAIGWGGFTLVFSSVVGGIAPTVIEAINKVGSLFYGPVLAMFLLAFLFRRTRGVDANIGLVTGLVLNLYLWLFEPQIFWFWWNFLGCAATLLSALAVNALRRHGLGHPPEAVPGAGGGATALRVQDAVLMLGMFTFIIVLGLIAEGF